MLLIILIRASLTKWWVGQKSCMNWAQKLLRETELETLCLQMYLCLENKIRRVDSLEKTLMLGGIGGKRRRG